MNDTILPLAAPRVVRCRAGASQRRRVTCLTFAERERAAAVVAAADRDVEITVVRRTRRGFASSSIVAPALVAQRVVRDECDVVAQRASRAPAMWTTLLIAAVVALACPGEWFKTHPAAAASATLAAPAPVVDAITGASVIVR